MASEDGTQPERPRTSRNRTQVVGWHPPQDLVDWLDAETERRASESGGPVRGVRSAILTEALAGLKERSST